MRPGVFSASILKKLKRREEEIGAGKALVLRNRSERQAKASNEASNRGKNKKKTRVAA